MLLFISADKVGIETGGGKVTAQELRALQEMGDPTVIALTLDRPLADPFEQDRALLDKVKNLTGSSRQAPALAHCYSGCLPKTVEYLKAMGCKVSYTVAAHDKEISRREHERLGMPFPYPHLTDPAIWQRYVGGYRLADAIVCPGSVPAETVRRYGPEFAGKRIEIIPHGVDLPRCKGDCKGEVKKEFATGPNDITDWRYCDACDGAGLEPIKPLPGRFTIGYLGAYGPDKGVRYLLEAWKKLDYRDGSILVLGGRESTGPLARHLLATCGGGSVHLAGWQEDVGAFYDSLSLYVQPSATEGFGLEVLEAMARGRIALCSKGAGAKDIVPQGQTFAACSVEAIMEAIRPSGAPWDFKTRGEWNRHQAELHAWDKIRARYRNLWRSLLDG